MTKEEKIEHYDAEFNTLANHILAEMKQGSSDWVMPWHKGLPQAMNQFNGRFYSGKNMLLLWKVCEARDYQFNRWATFGQWRRVNAKIKKNEKGILICQAIPFKKTISKQELTYDLFAHDPRFAKNNQKKNPYFWFKYIYVFNVAQVNNYDITQPSLFDTSQSDIDKIKSFIELSGAAIEINGVEAYYSYANDRITMPHMARFDHESGYNAEEKYYSTLLHELIHWTGHQKRCNRQFGFEFGNKEYALEELVAELGAAILSSQFNKRPYPRKNHAAYLNSWLNVLSQDFSYFTEALELARSAVYWLFEKTKILPITLKTQYNHQMKEDRLKEWGELV